MADTQKTIGESADKLAEQLQSMSQKMAEMASEASELDIAETLHTPSYFITALSIFVLACFVGYHVVWRVTPALHSPLMGITNAISSVIIVGAIIALGTAGGAYSAFISFIAVTIASINIFGGFIITRRMLHMFKKKA